MAARARADLPAEVQGDFGSSFSKECDPNPPIERLTKLRDLSPGKDPKTDTSRQSTKANPSQSLNRINL